MSKLSLVFITICLTTFICFWIFSPSDEPQISNIPAIKLDIPPQHTNNPSANIGLSEPLPIDTSTHELEVDKPQTDIEFAEKLTPVEQPANKVLVVKAEDRLVINSSMLDSMTFEDMDLYLDSLRYSEYKNHESFAKEENLTKVLTDFLKDKKDLQSHSTDCDKTMCGIVITADEFEKVNQALDRLTNKEVLGSFLFGGATKIYKYNGIYYGLLLGVAEPGKTLSFN